VLPLLIFDLPPRPNINFLLYCHPQGDIKGRRITFYSTYQKNLDRHLKNLSRIFKNIIGTKFLHSVPASLGFKKTGVPLTLCGGNWTDGSNQAGSCSFAAANRIKGMK
jgi:hypothetical protein